MFVPTRSVQPNTSPASTPATTTGIEPSALTTEESPLVQDTTTTPEESIESGLEEYKNKILATYDKIGKFDLKRLEVKVIDSGLEVLNRNKFLTKDQAKLITIGAHTSHGKSALLMQIAAYVAKTEPVIVHSFEMSSDEIETRLLAAIAGIPSGCIVEGSAPASRVEKAREDFESRKLFVSNVPNRSLNFVMSSVAELASIVGRPGLVVIDYGQQIRPGGQGVREQRVTEITDISAGLLTLAQQLKCNVLVGAQLNNEVLKRAYASKDEEGNMQYIPWNTDIREGSSIAHDSSVVLMVVRPYVFDRTSPKDKATFYCTKMRGGELWESEMRWIGNQCKFEDIGGRSERKSNSEDQGSSEERSRNIKLERTPL